ncbi:MAG: hypothetical protein M3Q79_03510 [bacterium]|nr:hypothetical protein [bacterium]
MKTSVLNVKVDENVKKRAKIVASSFGIPLSTLVNAYLIELGETGQIHFTASEPMTKKMEKIIEVSEKEYANGDVSSPFEAIEHLNSL